jgi:quercetin dioxygenase-like cupin family protein
MTQNQSAAEPPARHPALVDLTGSDPGSELVTAPVPLPVPLRGRDLAPAELATLAAAVAANPDLWQHHVAYDDEHRHYASLWRDAHVDVWVLCWTPQNDTGWHDHDISSGAVSVVQGTIIEHNLRVGGPEKVTEAHAGTTFSFGPEHIHRLTGLAGGSVSIHAYSPPLWRLGQYVVDDDGVLQRASVSYAEELRVLDALPEPRVAG